MSRTLRHFCVETSRCATRWTEVVWVGTRFRPLSSSPASGDNNQPAATGMEYDDEDYLDFMRWRRPRSPSVRPDTLEFTALPNNFTALFFLFMKEHVPPDGIKQCFLDFWSHGTSHSRSSSIPVGYVASSTNLTWSVPDIFQSFSYLTKLWMRSWTPVEFPTDSLEVRALLPNNFTALVFLFMNLVPS